MPKTVQVLNQDIRLQSVSGNDYICLADIARHKDNKRSDYLISNWLRNRNTIEFLGLWEQINNPNFNPIEFDGIKGQAGLNSFILTAKQWMERTGSDIRRNLARVNYRINTDAIQTHLIPAQLSRAQTSFVSASEADLLNMALFGQTASQWRDANPDAKGNIRDQATASQLVCLANLETLNALFISEGQSQSARLSRLNQIAIEKMKLLTADDRKLLIMDSGDQE